jgi:hypothetical protein
MARHTVQPYRYKEFPRVVYGPDGAHVTIYREDERPDGYVNHPDDVGSAAKAEKAARRARKAASESAAELRAELVEFLSAHNVDFDPSAPSEALQTLAEALKAHLADQSAAHDTRQ